MLKFDFKPSNHYSLSFVVTFCIKKKNEYCETATFCFNSKAFGSVENALNIFTGLVGNNLIIDTSLGYVSVRTDEGVYYENVSGVLGFAEIKSHGSILNKYLDIKLFYPESITENEIYQLIDENLGIKSYEFNIE